MGERRAQGVEGASHVILDRHGSSLRRCRRASSALACEGLASVRARRPFPSPQPPRLLLRLFCCSAASFGLLHSFLLYSPAAMPHKKQKRSLRDAATAAACVRPHSLCWPSNATADSRPHSGYDNAPTAGDSIPHPNHVAAESSSKPIGVLAPEMKKRKAKKEQPKDKRDSFGGRKDLGGLSKNMHRCAATSEP